MVSKNPLRWVPSLYFVQGLQFFVVTKIAQFMLKNMGVDNEVITRWLGVIGVAWGVKWLWSPFLEMVRSKKRIVVVMQFVSAAGLGLMALALQLPVWFAAAIGVLFLLAYASATHDIACDGLYMGALDSKQQATFAGWQGAFFNASKFLILGGLLVLAGRLETGVGVANAWTIIFAMLAVLLVALAGYNAYALPSAVNAQLGQVTWADTLQLLIDVVVDLCRKPGIVMSLLFILLFRLGEAQTQSVGPLFLIESRAKGGLGLTTEQIGGVYGTAGTLAFLVGSILGGYFTAWLGLRRALPGLIVAMAVPSAVFYYLSTALPDDLIRIGIAVAIENFAWGFGFVGVILFIMQVIAPGKFQTAHYAIGSGAMAIGLSVPTSFSGDVQKMLGYQGFFIWTLVCGLPALLLLFGLPLWRKPAPAVAA